MTTLYAGRFQGDADEAIRRLNDSLPFDQRLWREDLAGSIAHATMLGESGILTTAESLAIVEGLQAIESSLASGELALPPDAEDIHTAIELLLKARLGDLAGKLHTARSRNDQVAT
ncbi:MAG: lyase family protein, partial [bacterium]